jgi:putative transposase
MRFALIDGAKAAFPVHRLCRALGVSQSGYFAWRGRPACRRQRDDMVLLAHVRSAFALSNATYGSPRMTRELQDAGLVVGRRRVARLMRDNGLQARQKRRFKQTTDSNHAWPVAPNLLGGIARSIIKPSSTSTASWSRCPAKGIATTTPWSRRFSRP